MSHLLAGAVAAGAVATTAGLLAFRDSRRFKLSYGGEPLALMVFWGAISTYMLGFTLIRLAAAVGLESWLDSLYVLQTLGGAVTIVGLTAIIFGAVLPRWRAGFATGTVLGLAAIAVLLIFMGGYEGPVTDHWSVEFLPHLLGARILVSIVYMFGPMALAVLIWIAFRKEPPVVRRRMFMFGASAILMFWPNAAKYVVLVDGPWNFVEAVIMMIGTIIGWRSYQIREPSGNG